MSAGPAGPRILAVDPRAPAPDTLAAAVLTLRAGQLVAFPTETFYGLGANAFDPVAVARVFQAKGRPADKPLLVLVESPAMLDTVVAAVSPPARRLIARYWPGPLTLVLPARPELPAALTAGTGTIGVRVPGHPVALALVRAAAVPVTAPSANPHAAPPPQTVAEVVAGLGDQVTLLLDGGPTAGGPASTVVDLTARPFRVVRPGAVALTREDLAGP